jgi:hypothetical protein
MKILIRTNSLRISRGNAFGRVGAGRKTYFADRRYQPRTTRQVQFRKEHL